MRGGTTLGTLRPDVSTYFPGNPSFGLATFPRDRVESLPVGTGIALPFGVVCFDSISKAYCMNDRDLIILKVRRGQAHTKLLQYRVDRFLESKTHEVIHDLESEPGYLVVKVKLRRDVPPSIGLLAGEALYQFRSALDHFVCDAARRTSHSVDRNMEFPIFADPDRWKLGWKRRIGMLSKEDIAAIKEEQPFNRYDPAELDPLWWLAELARLDRHQAVHPVLVAVQMRNFRVNPPALTRSFRLISQPPGPLNGETEVARYAIDHKGPQAPVHVQSDFVLNVSFGGGSTVTPYPVVNTFGAIGVRVGEMLQRLL